MGKKPIFQGAIKTIFFYWHILITFIVFVFDFNKPLSDIIFFSALFTMFIGFFDIYNPPVKNRISIIWKIRLYLFGKP